VAPFIFFGIFFYLPIGKISTQGLSGAFWSDLTSHRTLSALWFTVWQATVSAGLSCAIAIPLAYFLYRTTFSGYRTFRALISVPFVLPNIVVAISMKAIFPGATGAIYIILANIFMNYGMATRLIGNAWKSLDSQCESAAALDGAGRLRTAISISLPQLRKSIASAFLLIFVYCAANFGIVLTLGTPRTRTLETEIYSAATYDLDFKRASSLVGLQILLAILILTAARFVTLRPASDTRQRSFPRRLDLRDLPVIIYSIACFTLLFLTPVLTLIARAFRHNFQWSTSNFTLLNSTQTQSLLNISFGSAAFNSVRNCLVVLLLSLAIGGLCSYLLTKVRIAEIFFLLPLALSSVILGYGYLETYGSGIFPLRSSWLVLPIAQSLVVIPLVIRFLLPALTDINKEIIESAKLDQADQFVIWWRIQMPLVRRTLLIAASYAVITSIGDFGAANFLAYGDQATLPVVLYQLISKPGAYNYGMAMAASSILIVVCGAIIYISEL